MQRSGKGSRRIRRALVSIGFGLCVLLPNQQGHACTIVVKADAATILVGNNEDYYDPRTRLWFIPGTDELHGRVIWGYDRYTNPSQGGMNERGLFIDINAVSFTGWRDDPEIPNANDDIVDQVLANCATLAEVVRFFETHDTYLDYVKYVVADARGDSAVFEWLDDKLHVIRRTGDYQISTNYLSPKEHTEIRYQISKEILSSQEAPTVDLIRKVLSATAYDVYFAQTLYSTICDLKNRRFYLYHFHYFEEVVEFDLTEELRRGKASHEIPSLFSIRTQNEYWFDRVSSKLGARDLARAIEEQGVAAAMSLAVEMKEKTRTYSEYDFPEWALQSLAKSYESRGRPEDAIAVFELTTKFYPDSSQAYVALGEALVRSEDKVGALRAFRRAHELDPDNQELAELIRALEAEHGGPE